MSTTDPRLHPLLQAWREDLPASADLAPALAWLKGHAALDELIAADALLGIEAAVRLHLGERVAQAGQAREKVVRKAARAAAQRLKSLGVSVPEARTATTWTLGAEVRVLPAGQVLLGLPEDDGYVPFLACTFGPEDACLSGGAAGPVQGYRDEDHGHSSRSQVRRVLNEAQGPHRMVEVELPLGLALLQDAFRRSGRGNPPGWGHLLSHLAPTVLAHLRELQPFERLPAAPGEDAMHQVDALLAGPSAVVMGFEQEPLFALVQEALALIGSGGDGETEQRRAAIQALVDRGADQLLDEARRTTWAWSLDVVALLAQQQGDEDRMRAARATALALAGGRPGSQIPFVREQLNDQLSQLVESVARARLGRPTEA